MIRSSNWRLLRSAIQYSLPTSNLTTMGNLKPIFRYDVTEKEMKSTSQCNFRFNYYLKNKSLSLQNSIKAFGMRSRQYSFIWFALLLENQKLDLHTSIENLILLRAIDSVIYLFINLNVYLVAWSQFCEVIRDSFTAVADNNHPETTKIWILISVRSAIQPICSLFIPNVTSRGSLGIIR